MSIARGLTDEKTLFIGCMLSAISALGVLLWVLSYSHYGLDFTDEGYYLNWISNPFQYNWGSTQFGFVYHPIYLLLNGQVGLLRVFNVLLTVTLATWMTKAILESFVVPGQNKTLVWLLSFSFSILSLLHFTWGMLLTPNYNSLNFQAIMILIVGVCYVENRSVILAGIIMGVSTTLIILAKPSSLIVLAPLVFIFIVARRNLTYLLCFSVAIGFITSFGLAVFFIDGNWEAFVDRLLTGKEFRMLQDPRYTFSQMFRIDDFSFSGSDVRYFFLLIFFNVSLLLLAIRTKLLNYVNIVFGVLVFFFLINLTLINEGVRFPVSAYTLLVLLALPLAIASVSIVSSYGNMNFSKMRVVFFFSIFVMVVPYGFSFGSNTNYWHHMSLLGGFWVLAGICFVRIQPQNLQLSSILTFAFSSLVVVSIFVNHAIENPYRKPLSLRLNTAQIKIGADGSELTLSEGYARYINEAKEKSYKAGLKEKDNIIDMTGQSPGLIYALGTKGLVGAWLVGGYPGSNQFISAALQRESCRDIAKSWLLIDNGRRRLDYSMILASIGTELGQYKAVANWLTASGAGGFVKPRYQVLLQPNDVAYIRESCEQIRNFPRFNK